MKMSEEKMPGTPERIAKMREARSCVEDAQHKLTASRNAYAEYGADYQVKFLDAVLTILERL